MTHTTFSPLFKGLTLTAFVALFAACNGGSKTPAETPKEEEIEQTDSLSDEDRERQEKVQEAIDIFMHNPRLMELVEQEQEDNPDDMSGGPSKNEIRFGGWTRDDFFSSSNEYLKAFRKYMDAWMQGKTFSDTEMDPTELEPYRERLTGKFIAAGCNEFLFGGMLYYFTPVEHPDLMLKVWLYSYVDNDGNIGKYEVRYVEVEEDRGLTQDDVQEFLNEYAGDPIANLW